MQKLNLGCGKKQFEGWTNIDSIPLKGVQIVHDLNKPLPFNDNTIDEVRAYHIIEHLDSPLNFLEEIWRVCKPGAKIELRFPLGWYAGAGDLTHTRFLNDGAISKLYVDCALNYYSKARFRELDKKFISTPRASLIPYAIRKAIYPFICLFQECYLYLEVVKESS